MADRFAIVASWVIRDAETGDDAHAVAVLASELVARDRVPRTVVRVCSEVSVADRPQVNVVQIAEVEP